MTTTREQGELENNDYRLKHIQIELESHVIVTRIDEETHASMVTVQE